MPHLQQNEAVQMNVEIPRELKARLRYIASANGCSLKEYVAAVLDEAADNEITAIYDHARKVKV